MKNTIEAIGKQIPENYAVFLRKAVKNYIEELSIYSEITDDPIPSVNFGERVQVAFFSQGIIRNDTEKNFTILIEQISSESGKNQIPDIILYSKDTLEMNLVIEAKYSIYKYAFLKLDHIEECKELNEAITEVENYSQNKAFAMPNQKRMAIVFHSFIENPADLVDKYHIPVSQELINKNIKTNIIKIGGNESDYFYFLFYKKHFDANKNPEFIGLELIGRIF